MKKFFFSLLIIFATITSTNAQNLYPTTGTVDVCDGTVDPTKYGILQVTRIANQPDNKFHISFIRNGNSICGMGYARGSNVWGIWHGNDNSFEPTIGLTYDQKVGIGTSNPQAKLAVNGDIFAKKIKVTQTGWSDFVFLPSYQLPKLAEIEQYIQQHHHLPEIPSASEVEKNGLDLGQNQAGLLQKIEELTLYIINMNKEVESLKKQVSELKAAKK